MIDPITYSNKGTLPKRMFIAMLEYMTGRLSLERAYRKATVLHENNPERPFFDHALDVLNINIHYKKNFPESIPAEGSLMVIANHPFGILDGLVMNHVLYRARREYKILTNEVLTKATPMLPWLLAVDDSQSSDGTRKNNSAIRGAMRLLHNGGCIGIFPAGRLARPRRYGQPCEDWDWQPLVGHLAQKCHPKAGGSLMILPIFFEGENSTIFKLASLAKLFTITRSLVIYELMNKRSSEVIVHIGDAFPVTALKSQTADDITRELRTLTLKYHENAG